MYVKGDTYDSGQYFLAAGSPAIDTGNKSSTELDLDQLSTQQGHTPDKGKADMGYHYPKSTEKYIEKDIL
jgi:hypothetical protein